MTDRERTIAMVALVASVVLPMLSMTSVVTALPAAGADLGDGGRLAWVVVAYMVASTITVPLVGKLGDVYGRKRLLEIAIGIFVLGSLACGAAQSIDILLAARVLQGLGGGALLVLAQTLIADIAPGSQRARYQGYMGAATAVSSCVGPVIGGFIVDATSWRWIFLCNVPTGIVAFVTVRRFVARSHVGERVKVDVAGLSLLTFGLGAMLVVAGSFKSLDSLRSPGLVVVGVLGLVALIALVPVERRALDPVVPVHLFRLRAFTVSCIVGFLIQAAVIGPVVWAPIFMQSVRHISATASGSLMVPLSAGFLISALVMGRGVTRLQRYKVFPVVGTALTTLAMVLLMSIGRVTSVLMVSFYGLLVGLGGGLVYQVLVIAAQNAAPRRHLGAATSGVHFARMMGGTIGLTAFGVVQSARLASIEERVQRMPTDPSLDLQDVINNRPMFDSLSDATQRALENDQTATVTMIFTACVVLAALSFLAALRLRDDPIVDQVDVEGPRGDELGQQARARQRRPQRAVAGSRTRTKSKVLTRSQRSL